MANRPLTRKQERFAEEFVATGNQAEAYRRAYNAENMSPSSIYPTASRLMDDSKIAARVTSIIQATRERAIATADDIARRAWEIATDPTVKASSAVAALSLLARQYSQFNERREESVALSGNVDVRALMALRSELAALKSGDQAALADVLARPLLISEEHEEVDNNNVLDSDA